MNARNTRSVILLIGISLALIPLGPTGCSPTVPPSPLYKPATGLTILGLDGATWDIIDPLIQRGELPGFKALKEQGSWGLLDTYVPTESVSIWTSIATGVSPTRHGIQSFTRRIPGTDRYVPIPGTDRQVPALWNIASDAERSVVVVKWFATWPAEKVNGAMLSPRLEPEDAEPRTWPPDLFAEIDPFRHLTIMDQLPQPPTHPRSIPAASDTAHARPQPQPGEPPMLIGQSQVPTRMFDDTSVWLAGRYTFEKYRPDLFMIYLKSTDRVEHFLWGAHTANAADETNRAEAEVMYGWYRYYDGIIQELLQDPSRTLIVVSDHGMRARDEIGDPYYIWDIDFDRVLNSLGWLDRSNTGTAWATTQLYTYQLLAFDKTVVFRVNSEGREPAGIVPADRVAMTAQSAAESLEAVRLSGNLPLFDTVRVDAATGTVTCRLAEAATLDHALMPSGPDGDTIALRDLLIRKGLPRGIHTDAPPGIIAIRGPGIPAGQSITGASVFDVTPIALALMGLPIARDFDGKLPEELIDPGYLSHYPIQWIDSYGRRATETALAPSLGDERMLNELRALGYIN
ncbi:alkaline phosphatase family protein [bacterium]|nr:alkaline phosphatase family protein [candidate division CSSED10-310 bacterium]